MKLTYISLGLILFLFALSPLFASSVEITQSGADAGTVMKGQFFTITVSGLSGSGSVNLIDTPSGFSSEEGTTKSFSDGTSSVTWTTAKISLAQSAITMKASISVQGSPSIAESSSFDVVLPPSITLSATPEEVEVNKGSSYTVTLNVQNLGGTSAKSISFSVSGSGMTASCPLISSLAIGASSSATCTVSAATAGTITTTFTAEPSNCDSKSDSITVTVKNTGGSPSGDSPGGSSTSLGGSSGGADSFWLDTFTAADSDFASGFSKILLVKQRVKVRIDSEDHYIGIVSLGVNSATVNISSDPQQATLSVGEERKFDVSIDGYYDIYLKLNSVTNTTANLTIMQIYEKVPASEAANNQTPTIPSGQEDIANPEICMEGAKRCMGGNVEICAKGAWTVLNTCSGGCDENTVSCNVINPPSESQTQIYLYGALVILAAVIVLMVFLKKRVKKVITSTPNLTPKRQ
jgi:hypothetical protein